MFFLLASQTTASDTTSLSLSDAVYADLALKGFLDNVSVSLDDGHSQNAIKINETRHWLPASTVKLFAALYAFKQISESKLNLYQSFPVEGKNVVPTELATDELPTIQEGDYLTLNRLLQQMITQSDNTAFNVLLDVLDRNAINNYIHSLGLTHSSIGSKLNLDTSQEQYEFDVPGYGINTTTAEDYTKAFTFIWKNKIPGAKSLLEILKQQKINYMLPLLLPKDVVVAHKHGDLAPLYHDGGIILGPKNSYVLSIFSNVGDPNIVAQLSKLIYTKDYSLVGESLKQEHTPQQHPALDPFVAQGKLQTNTLGAKTQIIPAQPITAADLGITAKDLALTQTTIVLPKVIIPADSGWHFLIPTLRSLHYLLAFTYKQQTQIALDEMRLHIAEAKDLSSRGKIQEADTVLQQVQQTMNTLAQEKTTKNDAQTQINIQTVSETRFQLLGAMLKDTHGTTRNELIKEIGQEAKNTLVQVQPNLPLATNATNPTQRPLIGKIVAKTNTDIIVKTAGGQEITIPLNDQTLTVKEKDITQESSNKPTLNSSERGTTVALIGSSVGNVFIPTFVLTHVPKELAAPEPVIVVKVNKKNHTMVIAENGVPIQVNVSDQTIIKSTDTSINFTAIKPGDLIVVHGKPLTQVIGFPQPSAQQTVPHVTQETPHPHTQGLPNTNTSPVALPTTQPTQQSTTQNPSNPIPPSQSQPKVIESTSIKVIEKKEDAAKTPAVVSQPKTEEKSKAPEPKKEEPKDQTTTTNKDDEKKEKK